MGMYTGEYDCWDWDDVYGEELDPIIIEFDRIIHSTPKATLYGHKQYMFWVPKSVHCIEAVNFPAEQKIISVEEWVTITRQLDPNYISKQYIRSTTPTRAGIKLLRKLFGDK